MVSHILVAYGLVNHVSNNAVWINLWHYIDMRTTEIVLSYVFLLCRLCLFVALVVLFCLCFVLFFCSLVLPCTMRKGSQ